MRLHGYCLSCHRVRLVTVSSYASIGSPVGLCSECEEKTRPLTRYEESVLVRVKQDTGREKNGDGPWQRAWINPASVAESSAMSRLAERGMIEKEHGSRKAGHRYRWRQQP